MQQYNEFNKVKRMNSKRMDSIFMNSENSKTSDHQRLLLDLTDKIGLRRKDIYVTLSNHSIY